jgi:hypothetical protein
LRLGLTSRLREHKEHTVPANNFEQVRPRPVTRLPDLAPAPARHRTADALAKRFGFSQAAAKAAADAIVDQSGARASIANPERRRVPGGDLLAIRVEVWTRRVIADPANMRIGPDKIHPFAVTPASGGESSRFAPTAAATSDPSGRPELVTKVESREHLEWAHAKAAAYVLQVNDWRSSIASQGVMEEVWVTANTYRHADGSPDIVGCQTNEGSSRSTATRDLCGADPVEDLYGLTDAALRAQIRRLNDAVDLGTLGGEGAIVMRAFTMPALIVVGFDPVDPTDAPPFHVAVQSLVALRHVDPPEPWGDASEMEALADAVLDELERRRIIKPAQRRWLAGAMTREEAIRSHLSDDPAVRAAHIDSVFTSPDPGIQAAIRSAVTAQSTRRQIRSKLKDRMASALIMRAVSDGARQRERIRKYLNDGIAQDWHRRPWAASHRPVEDLEAAALAEVDALAAPDAEPGPATLELAARAMYPLVTGLHLHADRGTQNNDQPDRRNPGGVLDTMRRSPHGVRQLAQAARDGHAKQRVHAVDETGALVTEGDGGRVKVVTDRDLRITFPAPGKPTKTAGPADSPHKRLANAVSDLGIAIEATAAKAAAVAEVRGHGGGALVEEEGVAPSHVVAWVRTLEELRDRLQRWRWTAEARQPHPPRDPDAEQEAETADYETMGLDALLDAAGEAGINVSGEPDREELIDLLMEAAGDR